MVIKAICTPRHLAHKRSSRCWLEPPLLATSQLCKHHQYLAKTTQVEQNKSLLTTKAELLPGSYFAQSKRLRYGSVKISGKSGVSYYFFLIRL